MIATRIFICHDLDDEDQREMHVLNGLCQRLEEAGGEVITYSGAASDEGFLPFLDQELPGCQWFILFQTPRAVKAAQVRMAVDTGLDFMDQKQVEGILRFVAVPSKSEELPPEWSAIPSFDATRDYLQAQEKLLLAFSEASPLKMDEPTPLPPDSLPASLPLSHGSDRPPTLSLQARTRAMLPNIYRGTVHSRRRRRIAFGTLLLLIIVLLGSVLALLFPLLY